MKWKYMHTREISFYGNCIAAINYSKSLMEEMGFSLDEYIFCSRCEKTAESFIDKKTVKNIERLAVEDKDFMKNLLLLFEKNLKILDELILMLNSYHDMDDKEFSAYFAKTQELFTHGFSALRLPLVIEGLLEKNSDMAEEIMRSAAIKDKLGEKIYKCMRFIESRLFEDIGKRIQIDPKLLVYATPMEIQDAIDGKNMIEREELHKRENYVIMIRKGELKIFSSGEALELMDSVERVKSTNLIGRCGSPGKATGKVKVALHASDLDGIRDPVIMVCKYTSEEYTRHFGKLLAVVTGDSGILNHAATIAREYEIPCVVGVRNAVKVLKDGDLVEVDADNGTVRKIE